VKSGYLKKTGSVENIRVFQLASYLYLALDLQA